MKKLFGLLLATFVAVLVSGRSSADLIVTTDLDPAAGIQASNSAPLNIGDQITATFYLQNTAASTLSIYNFSVQFGTGFEFVSRSEFPYAAGFLEFDASNIVANNTAFTYDGGNLGAGQTTPTGPNPVGTLTLRYIGGNSTDITPGLFDSSADLFSDANNNDVSNSVMFSGGHVNVAAVPEPSSMALLATAGIGGWVARRRAARKAAK